MEFSRSTILKRVVEIAQEYQHMIFGPIRSWESLQPEILSPGTETITIKWDRPVKKQNKSYPEIMVKTWSGVSRPPGRLSPRPGLSQPLPGATAHGIERVTNMSQPQKSLIWCIVGTFGFLECAISSWDFSHNNKKKRLK